jgi:hypothetical protein
MVDQLALWRHPGVSINTVIGTGFAEIMPADIPVSENPQYVGIGQLYCKSSQRYVPEIVWLTIVHRKHNFFFFFFFSLICFQRNAKGYSFAKLYFDVKAYEKAKR